MTVVYQITNIKTGKSYISFTDKTPEAALKVWMNNCSKKIYAHFDIAKDKKKYGRGSFVVKQIDSAPSKGEAQELVDNYIIKFDTLEPNGYNRSFTGIRKRNPDSFDDITKMNMEVNSIDKKEISIGEKIILEDEMADKYGLDNLVEPTFDKSIVTPQLITGLRNLADDLEKFGNANILTTIPKKIDEEMGKNGKKLKELLETRQRINPERRYAVIPENHILCTKCGKYYPKETNFYEHPDQLATASGVIHICRDCLAGYSEMIYNHCQNPIFTMISLCQLSNLIFDQETAVKASSQWEVNKDNPRTIAQYYFSEFRYSFRKRKGTPTTMLEFRNSHFVGDIFGFEEYSELTPKVFIKELNQNIIKEKVKGDKTIVENMEQKWGKGFKISEYEALDEEFQKLEKFLPKKTELHIEALKKYVIYNFKEKQALADGKDLKEVKEWSSLADKAADNAQLKIKQLSADFGEGVDSFAQLAETVEEYYSVIPTLPKARKMPYDDMDFLIWQNVNYIRRLEGKPEASYEEIYNFYDEELTKKMRDSGMTDDQIIKAKEERNATFRDLSDSYEEPLWLLPTMDEDDDDDEDGDGL